MEQALKQQYYYQLHASETVPLTEGHTTFISGQTFVIAVDLSLNWITRIRSPVLFGEKLLKLT